METATERCARIASALADLAEQEAAAVAHRDFPTVLALQGRCAPLVAFLAEFESTSALDEAVRAQLVNVQSRREQSSAALTASMQAMRTELQETASAQRRVARIAPVYGQPHSTRPRLHAVG
jgi:hypothetical protein